MTPPNEGGGGKPDEKGLLSNLILRDFGSFDNFRADIESAALTAFGSGWAWLGYDKKMGKLVVSKTIGAGNPLTEGITPILTIDVWEHGEKFRSSIFLLRRPQQKVITRQNNLLCSFLQPSP